MIADWDTDYIYFSEKLKNDKRLYKICNQIIEVLEANQIRYGFLPLTNDIWARDYMPIQVTEKEYIEYRYDPDYLQTVEYRNIKSYPDIICDAIQCETKKTNIIIDGGNVIKSNNAVIMTDKTIKENASSYSSDELIIKLKELFHVNRIIFIPWDKNEYFGHADGMIRFIDNNNVIINGYIDYYSKYFKERFYNALKENNINCRGKFKFSVKKKAAKKNWAYINYLQTKDILLIPQLGIEEDLQAIEQFNEFFPKYSKTNKIIPIYAASIVEKGGALNCISWTIKQYK